MNDFKLIEYLLLNPTETTEEARKFFEVGRPQALAQKTPSVDSKKSEKEKKEEKNKPGGVPGLVGRRFHFSEKL